MSKRLTAFEQMLESHPLFVQMAAAERAKLVRRCTQIELDRGELLYQSGDDASEVFVLLSGALQIEYSRTKETRGFAAAMLPAPAFVGEAQVLHERPWSGTGVALFPSVALSFKVATLEALFQEQPSVAWGLYRELAWRFLGAIDAWKLQQVAEPEELLARYLLSYAFTHQKVFPAAPVRVLETQQALGRATTLRRETVNRLLATWAKAGILESGARVLENLNLPALRRFLPDDGKTLLIRSMYEDRVVGRRAR